MRLPRGYAVGLDYGRSRPLDLLRSATARVIPAHMPPRQLSRSCDAVMPAAVETMGPTGKEFSQRMLRIRKDGCCISEGELHPGRPGIAASILDERQRILGSIALAGNGECFNAFHRSLLMGLGIDAARKITERIAG